MIRPVLTALPFVLTALCTHAADNPAEVLELPQVQVIGTTPLPGSGIALPKLPANAQVYTSRDVRRQRTLNLTDFIDQNATGISVNAAQGNPYQPDVNVRGFSASPLLGTPQGVSVFLDGVRLNEPFGDAINWDLIPQAAISSIQLIPGSNPAFGLNTLGGAIALYTKSGASEYPERPGGSLAVSGGSFGRRTVAFEGGGQRGDWDGYLAVNDSKDNGWARHNPSRVKQLFGKVGWQNEATDLDLSVASANNRLAATQTIPAFITDIRDAYTYPDDTRNRATLLTLKGSHAIDEALLLSGTAYARHYRYRNFSSNVNDDFDPPDSVEAFNEFATIRQHSAGAGLQLVHTGSLAGRPHKLSVGVSLDRGDARFARVSQTASFTADRGTVGLGPFEPGTDSDSTTRYLGAFASSSLDLAPAWTLTLAGRLNRADVRIADRSGSAPELDGRHRFTRFNPAVGLNFNPSPGLTTYAAYNEGMRAPTAIELTCADPAAPCKLPNNFLADPPLKPIVSRTLEAGARGKFSGGSWAGSGSTGWSAAIFRTDLADDLQFVSSNGVSINAGYFQNVGTTRRQGIELGLDTQVGPLTLALHYAFIDARFRTGFVENSPAHSEADANGAIVVARGDRMPSIPRHAAKVRAEAQLLPAWSLAATLQAAGGVHARGDENNRDAGGRVPGYAVVNLDTRYDLGERWQLYARIDNVFDRRYSNFGVLGHNVFTGPGNTLDLANPRAEQFRGQGAPRGGWVGLEYRFR